MEEHNIDRINELENEKYNMLNKFFYLMKQGIELEAVGADEETLDVVATEAEQVVIGILAIDQELVHLSEELGYDYKITLTTEEM